MYQWSVIPRALAHPDGERLATWQVARQAVTLDQLSNGRLIFAAALGYQALDFTVFGADFDLKHRAEQLDEGLGILQGPWSNVGQGMLDRDAFPVAARGPAGSVAVRATPTAAAHPGGCA